MLVERSTVCTLFAGYRQSVEALQALTHQADEINQKKRFRDDNAVRVYRRN
jgi:hypothetical protein